MYRKKREAIHNKLNKGKRKAFGFTLLINENMPIKKLRKLKNIFRSRKIYVGSGVSLVLLTAKLFQKKPLNE